MTTLYLVLGWIFLLTGAAVTIWLRYYPLKPDFLLAFGKYIRILAVAIAFLGIYLLKQAGVGSA